MLPLQKKEFRLERLEDLVRKDELCLGIEQLLFGPSGVEVLKP